MAKVLIIGAGLGGLTLAHILHRYQVPFEIFERDAAIQTRKQGWAVALVECMPRLEKWRPPVVAQKLYSNSVNVNTGDYDELVFVDLLTGECVGRMGGVPRGERGHFLRVSREKFREFLVETLDAKVSMGKAFSHYTTNADGVTAFFKDGSSATGSLLVGADGAHSHTLDQLLGPARETPTLSENVAIFGEVELPKELYEPIRALSNAVILGGASKIRLQIGMLHMDPDRSKAFYFWALMISRSDPAPLADWIRQATREEIYEFVLQIIGDFEPAVSDLIRYGGPAAIVKPQPQLVEYVLPDTIPSGRVTLLGDAAHVMAPFRGAGANTAILDACDLGQLVTEAWQRERDFSTVLDSYHALMIPRGKENVLSSRAAGSGDNPVEQWAIAFRRPDA